MARVVRNFAFVALLMFGHPVGAALADNWVAERVRGHVFVLSEGQWVALERGDIVADNRPIQSGADGHATFTRDAEIIQLGAGTLIQIVDLGTPGQNNTIIRQQFGTITVEAEVQNVQHFRVETPFLAAIVKGTKFTVSSDSLGGEVSVQRGRVEVRDEIRSLRTEITRGQSAGNRLGNTLSVSGPGVHQQVTGFASESSANPNGNGNGGGNGNANGHGNGTGNANGSNRGNGNGNNGNHGNGNNGNGNGNSG